MRDWFMRDWLNIAFERPTVRRALKAAAIVGLLQITINHGDHLLRGDVDATRMLKMVLTACVPYLVSTFSSVGAVRQMRRASVDTEPTAGRSKRMERL